MMLRSLPLACHCLTAISLALVAPNFGSSPAMAAGDLMVEARSDYIVPVEVNGSVLRLRVDPGASGSIHLNPGAAKVVGLMPPDGPATGTVGPVRLHGGWRDAGVRVSGIQGRARFLWLDRDVVAGADGIASPHALFHDTVTFDVRQPQAGERSFAVAMDHTRDQGLVFRFRHAGKILNTRFSLHDPISTATASAGAHLANHLTGSWTGGGFQQNIRFNVIRPVRPMRFERPLRLSELLLRAVAVRTADDRGHYQLPPNQLQDDDEIVVTAQRSSGEAKLWLMIGSSDLSGCSSIRYHRRPRQLVFTCSAWPAQPWRR